MTPFSVYMEDYLPVSTPLNKLSNSTESKKYLTKAPSVICFGLILMTGAVGVYLPEELAIPSDRTYLSNLTTPMVLPE